jgi:hypothetical protein
VDAVHENVSQNFAMINLLSLEIGDPAALLLVSESETTLTLTPVLGGLGNLTTWDVVPGGSALAVRPTINSSLNLNVAGNGP